MEDQYSPLSWASYYQEEGTTEDYYLKHSLLYTNLELEKTILCVHGELARKEDELMHLKGLLTKTIKERDDAQSNCQSLMLDKLLLQQQLQLKAAAPSLILTNPTNIIQDEPIKEGDSNSGFSSSAGCDDNATSSPPPPEVLPERLLPEKGKFLQAVLEAGPLLQTLLLAGPLPQWQHPPPQLSSTDIPPVTVSSPAARIVVQQETCLSKKRGLVDEYCEGSKNHKVAHQSSLTNI